MLVKEELYDKVIESLRVNERVMSLAIRIKEVVRVICAYAPQSGKWMEGKEKIYDDLSREWATHHMSEMIIGIGDINRNFGRNIDGFHGVDGGFSIGERNQEVRVLLESCDARHLCITTTWLRRADKKK